MAVSIPTGNDSVLENTIGTLRRCLEFAATPGKSTDAPSPVCASAEACEEPSSSNSSEPEERSPLPGDSHMFSDDETVGGATERSNQIKMVKYKDESQIGDIMRLITKDLSEPYSIYTYRYFIHGWPELCLLAYDSIAKSYVGAVVCKLDITPEGRRKGYIAMLAVDESCRRLGIGTRLVTRAIQNMQQKGCDEVVLETEVTNRDAMRLYSNLGFIREKRLFRYYLNGVDAYRLKLFFTPPGRPRFTLIPNNNSSS